MTGQKAAAKSASKASVERAEKRKRSELAEPPARAGVAQSRVEEDADSAGRPNRTESPDPPARAGVSPVEEETASGSHEAAHGAGVEVTAGAATRLVCTEAASVLAKFSKGTQRIPLEKMGISPFNRRINGPYVHKLGKRILSVEGFARLRYRSGWCHEPNPDDELSVARFTNAAAVGSGLLAPVPNAPLFGSFAKSHLLSFLQALKSGQVFWDQTQDLMLPEPATQELLEHLQHGMFYEVLGWEATVQHAESLRALIAADNFDAGFALGQTEMHLLVNLRTAIVVARPPVGQTVFDVVRAQVERTSGQHWARADVVAFYNCALVLGDEHLQFLADLVDTHVAVDRVAVRPADFKSAAALAVEAPWVKVALLATQYMSPDNRMQAGPRGRSFGNVIDRSVWERLTKATAAELEPVEAFLRGILERYALQSLRGVSRLAWGRAIPGLFCRVGGALALTRDLSGVSSVLPKIEQKLRAAFVRLVTDLPPPVSRLALERSSESHGASCGSARNAPAGAGAGGSAAASSADSAPALSFVGGKMVFDFAAVARSRGLVPGATVRCVRAHEGVAIDARGVVQKLEADRLLVLWPAGDAEARLLPCTEVASLLPAEAKQAPAGAGDERRPSPQEVAMDRAKALLALPRGLVWTSAVDCDTRNATAALLAGVLWQMHQAHFVSAAELRFWEVSRPAPVSLACAAQVDYQAGRLALVPWPVQVFPNQPDTVGPEQFCIPVILHFGEQQDTMYLLGPPSRTEAETTETPCGPSRVLYPFWDIIGAKSGSGRGQALRLVHEFVDIPLHAVTAGKALAFRRPPTKRTLRVSVPFLTNAEQVIAGDRLWFAAAALVPEAAAAKHREVS